LSNPQSLPASQARIALAQRMSHIKPFEAMEILAAARVLEAAGHDVIHMEIGEPDLPTPPEVIAAAKQALDTQRIGYTPPLGIMLLREAIAAFYQSHYGVTVPVERIAVTAGSSAALLLAFGLLLDADDEVLMSDPSYPCNRYFVATFDAKARCVPVGAAENYQLNADLVARKWTPQSVAALVATPSNPTGTVVPPHELAAIHQAVSARGGTLIVDEIYQGLTYESSAATALAFTNEAIVINSFSKYFYMTGWRLGWMVVPEKLVRPLETLTQNLFISPPALAQYAALAAFTPTTLALLEERRAEMRARRDFLVPALRELGLCVPVTPQGAFYVYADSSALAPDSFALCQRILQSAHVAMTPGKDFGVHRSAQHVRIAYTQSISRLEEAVARLRSALKTL
jgi:aspartate/methionine/tyrosine aminotransferase